MRPIHMAVRQTLLAQRPQFYSLNLSSVLLDCPLTGCQFLTINLSGRAGAGNSLTTIQSRSP